jgi:hypothetical protein
MAEPTKKNRPRHSHVAFGFRRQGKKWGDLLECGTGYLDFAEDDIEAIAAKHQLDAAVVRDILQSATGHLFINRHVFPGGTGYFCIRPGKQPVPPWVEEREPPAYDGPLPPEHLR